MGYEVIVGGRRYTLGCIVWVIYPQVVGRYWWVSGGELVLVVVLKWSWLQ